MFKGLDTKAGNSQHLERKKITRGLSLESVLFNKFINYTEKKVTNGSDVVFR